MANEIPKIDLNQPAEEIRQQFEQALADIQAQLRLFLYSDTNRADLMQAEREIQKILNDLDAYIDENTTSMTEAIVVASVLLALYELGKPTDVKLSRKEKALLDYASSTLNADLKQVVNNLNRQSRRILKQAYFDSLARTGTRTKKTLSRDVKKLLDDADLAVIDKKGRRWKTSTYVDLVVRENLMTVERETSVLESLRNGNGLAYISHHPKTTDGCKEQQYKIVRVSEDGDKEFPYYRDLPHIFHVNCRHRLIPIRNLSNVPSQVRAKNSLTE